MARFLSRRSLVISLIWLGFQAHDVRAAIMVNTGSPTVAPGSGGFTWTYNMVLTGPGDSVSNGGANPSFFTIYDFAGFVEGSDFQPNGDWTFSFQPVGITPGGVIPIDSPGVVNLTWTYSGDSGVGIPTGQFGIVLGDFGAVSSFGESTSGLQSGQNNRGPLLAQNLEQTIVPLASVIPEPASLGLWAMLGLGAAWYGRRRLRIIGV